MGSGLGVSVKKNSQGLVIIYAGDCVSDDRLFLVVDGNDYG
ncbi:hypothetical protein DSUL_60010 [Desulfovibrionales bacterium]